MSSISGSLMNLFPVYYFTIQFLVTILSASIVVGASGVFDSGGPFQAAFRSNGSRVLKGRLSGLLGGRQETCSFPEPWVSCPDDVHCCPADQPLCCIASDTCCPTTAACTTVHGVCCPLTAETCGKGFCLGKGQTCCGEGFCDVGIECLKSSSGSEVCCNAGESACDGDPDYCCPEGSVCAGDGLCERITESISMSMSSARTSTKPSSTAAPTIPKTTISFPATRTTTTIPSISSSACTPTSAAKRDLDSPHAKRQTADDPGDYLLVNGTCLPVMDFPCVQGLSDQLCASMCGGTQAELAAGNPKVLNSTTMVLTWRGGRVADPGCKALNCTALRDSAGDSMQCDEFPPASTLEGGPGSHLMCISWKQNSGLQGPLIRRYRAFYNLQPNDQFVVRMGSCTGASSGLQNRGDSNDDSPSVAAGPDGDTVLSSGSTWWIADPRANGTNNAGFVVIPLSNITAGTYNCTLSFSNLDHLESLDILDGDGWAYWSQSAPFSAPDFAPSFSVNDSDDLVVAAAAAQSVSVSASIEATLLPKASSAANRMVPFERVVICGLLIGGLVVML
ncbi:hypothetical protein C8R45DRAFT_1138574 [Mycena sanguinolenta]|nr:hypothetical protein C8R45DRAFT_1138574 [Mycena sanguinolenta]